MKTIARCLSLALAFFATLHFSGCPGFAQGTAFTYQGQLTAGGQAANGCYDMQFSLYDAATNGTQVGATVTNLATGVTNGLFTVAVDFGPTPYNGQPLWLQIAVNPTGSNTFTALCPLQPLTSTPYAVQSLNSGTASNVTGPIALSQMPSAVVTNGETNLLLSGMFSGNGSALTNVPGTMPWQSPSGANVIASANQGYILSNAQTTLTLPFLPNVGDIVTVRGIASNQWTVLPNAGQTIPGYPAPPGTFLQVSSSGVQDWESIASSSDGTKLVAVASGGLYGPSTAANEGVFTSSNGGMSWVQQVMPTNAPWLTAASSVRRIQTVRNRVGSRW